jgi:hypothetical protein
MDDLEIAHQRLANQRLANQRQATRRLATQRLTGQRSIDERPVAIVRHFGAMQAQEYTVAKWSIGERAGVDDATVQKLVDDGAILRTHALRPTWHFVAAADIGWLQALTGPRVHAITAYYYRLHGIDDEAAAKSNRVITAALAGGNQLTRTEVGLALAAANIEATGVRLAHLMMRAELDGLIANGSMRGKQHTYALVSERAPDRLELTRDEALRELTIRYFTSHGPATIKDFAWWATLTVADIKRGLGLAGEALASEQIDGLTYWFAPSTPVRRERSPSVHVLQGYDEYVVAYAQSRRVVNVAGLPVSPPNDNSVIHPIVLDSQVIGYWRRIVERSGLVARPIVATELTSTQRDAIDKAFASYARFAGTPVTVAWPPNAV